MGERCKYHVNLNCSLTDLPELFWMLATKLRWIIGLRSFLLEISYYSYIAIMFSNNQQCINNRLSLTTVKWDCNCLSDETRRNNIEYSVNDLKFELVNRRTLANPPKWVNYFKNESSSATNRIERLDMHATHIVHCAICVVQQMVSVIGWRKQFAYKWAIDIHTS